MNIHCIYRISDSGYLKEKPDYIGNENCFRNFIDNFVAPSTSEKFCTKLHVIMDNVSDATESMVNFYSPMHSTISIRKVNVGNGAGTFNLALDYALGFEDDDIVYFVENDYLHKPNSKKVLVEGLALGAQFVTLYDHPDKYLIPERGGNPQVESGGEVSRVLLSRSCHWKLTNSTTMTFATTVSVLKTTELILRKYTSGTYPFDYEMFLALRDAGYSLISPLPGYSTHGESKWLAPLTNWKDIANDLTFAF